MTRQRTLILDIMRQECPNHLTADEIFARAREQMPRIARGTVYRNLIVLSRPALQKLQKMSRGGQGRKRN